MCIQAVTVYLGLDPKTFFVKSPTLPNLCIESTVCPSVLFDFHSEHPLISYIQNMSHTCSAQPDPAHIVILPDNTHLHVRTITPSSTNYGQRTKSPSSFSTFPFKTSNQRHFSLRERGDQKKMSIFSKFLPGKKIQ